MANPIEVYVSPDGRDTAAGTIKAPVATVERGLTLLRQKRKAAKGGVGGRLILRGGTHFLRKPLVLTPADSGIQDEDTGERTAARSSQPLVIAGHPGERATLSGGRLITGWRETSINDRPAWVAALPKTKGGWSFRQLWVNGRRATPPRLPKRGLFQIEKLLDRVDSSNPAMGVGKHGQRRFVYRAGDLAAFDNLDDVEFVALHFWIESRIPIARLDPKRRRVELAWAPRLQLTDDYQGAPAYYYVENAREALTEPGEWYLDRNQGRVYYLPREGERIEDVEAIAPALPQIVRLGGDAGAGKFVDHVRLENLTFSHNEHTPDEPAWRATPQAACHVPGAVAMRGARFCTIDRCTVEHVGSYGVEITDGSSDCAVTRSELRDLAAGGVKVFHAILDGPGGGTALKISGKGQRSRGCRRIVVADNHVHDGGHRWRQAVGVLVGRCSGVQVLHNHVHDFDYTGVSVGWTWGYEESDAYGNIIEWNHIHDIGRGALSDMGGIYTLGVQPGTRLRYNLVHDVESRGYGGWGIYPDEGSSFLLIENNLICRTKYASFHTHYGMGNTVRNNIFAFGRLDSVVLGKHEPHEAFIFEHNIVLTEQPKVLGHAYNNPANDPVPARFDHNLYWCTTREPLDFDGRSFDAWRATGRDEHSVVADPRVRGLSGAGSPTDCDFRLPPDSPAIIAAGFVPFDLTGVGPRETVGAAGD